MIDYNLESNVTIKGKVEIDGILENIEGGSEGFLNLHCSTFENNINVSSIGTINGINKKGEVTISISGKERSDSISFLINEKDAIELANHILDIIKIKNLKK